MKIVSRLIEYVRAIFGLKTVTRLLEDEEISAARAWADARNSRLGWVVDFEPRLHRITAPLINKNSSLEHSYRLMNSDDNNLHFQISAFTNRLYPARPDKNGVLEIAVEQPASLVFSLHPNGSVAVSVYPHKSDWGTFGRDAYYIIGLYRSTNELAGSAGDAIIRGHIKLFLRLASLSLAVSLPTKSSARLLEKLESETNCYSRIYDSKSEQRRAIVESELALGAGLAAGLIASTLFPMAQSIGKEAGERAQKVNVECKARDLPNTKSYELCRSGKDYHFHSLVASALSTEILMISAALISTVVVGIMWKRLKSR